MAQHRLRPIRDRLLSLGHDVVSSWLDEAAKPEHLTQVRFDTHLAIKDFTEVVQCDCVILDTLEPSTTGGRYVELGIALANSKLIYQVGQQVGIFERLVDEAFATWEHAINYLEAWHKPATYVATGMEGKAFSQERDDNKWIKWHGGRCPVPIGTLVDVQQRDGSFGTYLHAGQHSWDARSTGDATAEYWEHDAEKSGWNIVAWRRSP